MSRVGKSPITIPAGVELSIAGNVVTVKGKLGTLTQEVNSDITLEREGDVLTVVRPSDHKDHRAQHGLYRALIQNMILGVSQGFAKNLELVGVGYRASHQGQNLELALGYSHIFVMQIPSEVKLNTVSEKGKNPIVELASFDKQLLGAVASKIRSLRKPEPFKGKGVRYVGEIVRRKAGKSGAKK
ncbi:MAG: 50S ribosomal protein L6 [Bacteroidetes bacterium]|jgi:large subunit ribosomal protein L6|nr:50S ribosomal protein L6 [Bacteroidota bacterium]